MSDIIDEFLAKLKKELEPKKQAEQYDPDWFEKYAAVLQWKSKTKVEKIIEKQEAFEARKHESKKLN